jgi:uncharacterized protein (DUF1501 family)
MNRRFFLQNGALALAGTAALPNFLLRATMAQSAPTKGNRLVVIFQRGAVDGLNVVVPYRENNYYTMRPTIGIAPETVLDLDGNFGLHPSLAPFADLYKDGHLAVIHAAGSPNESRSHFDAQDYMENGTPGNSLQIDGWLNRALQAEDLRQRNKQSPFRAVALGSQLPKTLTGSVPALAINDIANFNVAGRGPKPAPIANTFESIYAASGDQILHQAGEETFDAVRMMREANATTYTPTNGATYPNGEFGRNMKQIAQLLKSNLGVETAFTDMGGWDTHVNQGGAQGQLANRLTEFSQSIAAFWRDLGDEAESVTLVTMSEFGRTAKQNGTGGTDHGHGNVMFVLGGRVNGGRVYGKWPGLETEQLYEQRDLAITTDFRAVLGELLTNTMRATDLEKVFPEAGLRSNQFLNLV